MKKVIAFFAMAIVSTVLSVEAKNTRPVDEQYIITDCGTIHPIPANSSVEYACEMVDVWSRTDCKKK